MILATKTDRRRRSGRMTTQIDANGELSFIPAFSSKRLLFTSGLHLANDNVRFSFRMETIFGYVDGIRTRILCVTN